MTIRLTSNPWRSAAIGGGALMLASMWAWPVPSAQGVCKARAAEPVAASAPMAVHAAQWVCPMHPQVVSDRPGACPICGMTLVKAGGGGTPRDAVVRVPADVQARMGLRTEAVGWSEFRPALRVPAEIVGDERQAVSLSPKVDGWVRALGVSVVGQPVRKGQALFTIYSPELQQRQRDYLDILARRDALQAQSGGMAAVGSASPDLMLASVARERFRMRAQLAAADVPESVLQDMEKTRRVPEVVPVLAEHDGVVTAIGAREGAYVMPAQVVLSYADPAAAWVELALTPDQLAGLRGPVDATLGQGSGEAAQTRVRVDPGHAVMDTVTRTARVRARLPAMHGARLLPGMLVDAELRLAPRRALTVARDALTSTGAGDFVILATDDGGFRQAAVRAGVQAGERVEIVTGLAAGDRVVTNGQFLLGAEASQQAARERLAAAAP